MSIFAPLAKAIAEQLLAAQKVEGTFSRAATIEHPLDDLRGDEELAVLRVDVLIGDKKCEPADRARQSNRVRMDVCIRQKIKCVRKSKEEQELVEGLLAYVEQLDDYLSSPPCRRLTAANWAEWENSETVIPYSPWRLREERLFYAVFRLEYSVFTPLGN
jgi:hypothetical protein